MIIKIYNKVDKDYICSKCGKKSTATAYKCNNCKEKFIDRKGLRYKSLRLSKSDVGYNDELKRFIENKPLKDKKLKRDNRLAIVLWFILPITFGFLFALEDEALGIGIAILFFIAHWPFTYLIRSLKEEKVNFITILVRTIVFLPIFIFLGMITEFSKMVLPVSGPNGVIRYGLLSYILYLIIVKVLNKINIDYPRSDSYLRIKKQLRPSLFLSLGWYRLALSLWFILPITFGFLFALEDEDLGLFIAILFFIIHWPLIYLVKWIKDGFNEQKTK